MQTAAKLPELARLLGLTGPMSGKRHHFGTCAPSKDAALIFFASINLGRTRDRSITLSRADARSSPSTLATTASLVARRAMLRLTRSRDQQDDLPTTDYRTGSGQSIDSSVRLSCSWRTFDLLSPKSASGRFCCKSRFALVVGNSAGRRCAFRVRMWGASSPHVKLTGDFANVSDAIRIGDCFPFRNFAKNSSPCNFRLLQQYRPKAAGDALCYSSPTIETNSSTGMRGMLMVYSTELVSA
jgi:hypothetical protein